MPFLTKKIRFLRIFQISQLKLGNSSFKQNGLCLQNSILIKLKYCLSILEILEFALLRYPKRAVPSFTKLFYNMSYLML